MTDQQEDGGGRGEIIMAVLTFLGAAALAVIAAQVIIGRRKPPCGCQDETGEAAPGGD